MLELSEGEGIYDLSAPKRILKRIISDTEHILLGVQTAHDTFREKILLNNRNRVKRLLTEAEGFWYCRLSSTFMMERLLDQE